MLQSDKRIKIKALYFDSVMYWDVIRFGQNVYHDSVYGIRFRIMIATNDLLIINT